jgi:hypothetical protein
MVVKKRVIKKKAKKKRVKKKPAPTTSILDKIQPVSELETNLVMLVYGRSGTGKTHFGSTFPRPCERGTETIANEDGIDVVRIEDWQEIEELLWALKDGMEYESIVIDQVTNLQDLGMYEVLRKQRKGRDETFSQRNWGQLSGMLKQFITDFRDLADRYNLLMIAHERIDEPGDEEDEHIEPNMLYVHQRALGNRRQRGSATRGLLHADRSTRILFDQDPQTSVRRSHPGADRQPDVPEDQGSDHGQKTKT